MWHSSLTAWYGRCRSDGRPVWRLRDGPPRQRAERHRGSGADWRLIDPVTGLLRPSVYPRKQRSLVVDFAAAARHEVVEFGADGVVQRRRGELLQLLAPDLAGPGGGVLAAQLEPALEVGGGREHRAVEALAEPLHGVRRAEEVPAVTDFGVRAERQRFLGDLQRGELHPQHLQQLDVDDELL